VSAQQYPYQPGRTFPAIGDPTMRILETVMSSLAALTAFALVVEVINL
jgi:hypothetical protein